MTVLTRVLTALAWLVVGVALLLPVGAMVLRSFQVERITTTDDEVVYAVGAVKRTDQRVDFSIQAGPGEERMGVRRRPDQIASIDTVYSLRHYRFVFGDARTRGLLLNSLWISLGGATLALLLGVPLAWLLARTSLRGRTLIGWLAFIPALLPPFFVALGGARRLQGVLIDLFGLAGAELQLWNSILVFGLVLNPITVLLVAPALRAVPAGPWESAALLGGPRAAFRTVTRPAVLPAVAAAWVLGFVLALADFTVPDLLGFMLPAGGAPAHVFSTELVLQWKQHGNIGRAVATGAPLVLATLIGVVIAWALMRKSPAFSGTRGDRIRTRVALGARSQVAAYVLVGALIFASVVVPLWGIASWADGSGESSADGTAGSAVSTPSSGTLFDFSSALDRTHGSREERDRWLKTAGATALVCLLLSLALVRHARRRRGVGVVVGAVALVALAVPGLVLSVGHKLLWNHVPAPWPDGSVAGSVLVMVARFLPYGLAAAWLALRAIPQAQEDAAALAGADAWVRARAIWGPRALPGLIAGGLLVFLLALREIDAVYLVDPRILPLRLYDKIHFNRLTDEANLLFLCVGILLIPALALAVLSLRRRGPESP